MEEPDYGEAHNWALRAMQWGETDAAYTLGVRCAVKNRDIKKMTTAREASYAAY
jgi:hypothetical protein